MTENIIESFKTRYKLHNRREIVNYTLDEETLTIIVHTTDPRVWVDIPSTYEEYFVKMWVTKKNSKNQ